MKKFIGYLILSILIIGIFTLTALAYGFWVALIGWVISGIIVGLFVLAVDLIFS